MDQDIVHEIVHLKIYLVVYDDWYSIWIGPPQTCGIEELEISSSNVRRQMDGRPMSGAPLLPILLSSHCPFPVLLSLSHLLSSLLSASLLFLLFVVIHSIFIPSLSRWFSHPPSLIHLHFNLHFNLHFVLLLICLLLVCLFALYLFVYMIIFLCAAIAAS